MLRQASWARIAVEGIVIVGSILLAFGIQAWWDERQEGAQRDALLQALQDDFAATEQQLADVKSRHAQVAYFSKRVLDYGEVGVVPVSERDSLDRMVGGHFLRASFDPPMGTVQALLGSGRLDILKSPRLVAALNRWSSLVAGFQGREDAALDHFYDRIYPFLAARLDLEDLDKGYAQYLDFPWEQEPANAYTLVADREFLSIIYMHWVLKTNLVELTIPGVETALAEIRQLIDTELQ